MEVAELYTPLYAALAELERRQRDTELQEKVRAYFKDSPPLPELLQGPRAVMARAVFTPTLEMLYFMDIQSHLPIKPILYEFTRDKFVALNFEKACLANLTFFKQEGGHKVVTGTEYLVDFGTNEGKAMRDVRTIRGEPFVDLHHRLLRGYFPDFDIEIAHFSDWFRASYSFHPSLSYLRYLGLFITHGILFENFILEKHSTSFTEKKVMPAFAELERVFGVKPLIVPIDPRDSEAERYWCYYPEEVRTLL